MPRNFIEKIQTLQNKIQTGGAVPANLRSFKRIVWSYYKENKRNFSWRNTDNPYHIVVSEIMLQQTQTKRVEQKYLEWIHNFPDWNALALAPLKKILLTWQKRIQPSPGRIKEEGIWVGSARA